MQRLANPKDGGQYAFYYTVIIRAGRTARKGKNDLRHQDAERVDARVQPDAAARRLPLRGWRCRRRRRSRRGRRSASRARPAQYGRNLVSTGPYMIKGSDEVDISSCDKVKPASGFDGQTHHGPRPQPELQRRRPTRRPRGRTTPTSSSSWSTPTRTTSKQDRGRRVRHGHVEHPAAVPEEVLDGPEPEAVLPPELG